MPLRQLIPFIDAMPHVRAQAQMRTAEATAVGAGTMSKSGRQETTARWLRDVRTRPQRSRSPEELAAVARAAGIEFVRVPKAAAS